MLLRRKLLYLATAFVIAMVVTMVWGTHFARNGLQPHIMLLYVGAEDCAPCRAWRNGEGAVFLASAESSRIAYREVKSPRLQDVLNDENWPLEIRDYRGGIHLNDGVPLWLVISDREIVDREFGASAWKQRVLPKVRSYLR